jgi:NitT/TauT family transport system ATP-binding protein
VPAPPTEGAHAVAIRAASVEFGDTESTRRRVLSNLSLDVPRGQFLAIIGASGCGKTTLLNMVSGLVAPTTGEVTVFDQPARVGRADVAYMFARDALLPWRTARRNVELALELHGNPRSARRERAADLLDRVHMSSGADRYPAELSQGMRQRVALARTWATGPELLLMDEPFAALDALTRASVRDTFLGIWNEGAQRKTVLFVTHDLTEALLLADRVVMVTQTGIGIDVCVPFGRPRDLKELMAHTDYRDVYDTLERALTIQR